MVGDGVALTVFDEELVLPFEGGGRAVLDAQWLAALHGVERVAQLHRQTVVPPGRRLGLALLERRQVIGHHAPVVLLPQQGGEEGLRRADVRAPLVRQGRRVGDGAAQPAVRHGRGSTPTPATHRAHQHL